MYLISIGLIRLSAGCCLSRQNAAFFSDLMCRDCVRNLHVHRWSRALPWRPRFGGEYDCRDL